MFLFLSRNIDQNAIYREIILKTALASSVAASLITVLKLGFNSREGRYYLSLFVAMLLWFIAELIYSYYQLGLQVDLPYPSIADFLWLLGFVFLGYHYFYSFRIWKQANVIKRYSIIIAAIVSTTLIGILMYLSFQNIADEEFDLEMAIVDILYLVGNGVLLVPAIVIMWSLRREDILLLHRILLSLFIVINMLGDVGYAYHIILVDDDTFVQQEWIWGMVYTIAYIILAAGLIWFNKISGMINKNIQRAIDKQYPDLERMWKRIDENSETTNFESKKEYTEYQINGQDRINQKIINLLETARKEILFLISTEEMLSKIKNEIFKFMRIIEAHDIESRILIPRSSISSELVSELSKLHRINIQYLYNPINQNFGLFIIDVDAILYLITGDDNSLITDKFSLSYSNKEEEVQSYGALFERCWILPVVHEIIS